ncbi:MAG: hypothetical protein SGJ18_14095 [Pseudomonadota bacterium]|nr:hypothetical protein [Pseudomonadota bacterium]
MTKFKVLLMLLMAQILGCNQAKEMLSDVIAAISSGNLPALQKYLTNTALDQMKSPQDLAFWTAIVNQSRRNEFTVDSLYDFKNGKILATAYGAFDISDSKVIWTQFKLECTNTISISGDHAFPDDCKISEFSKPIVVSTSFEKTQVLLYAYSCANSALQQLLFKELKNNPGIDPRYPAFPNGPTAIDVIKTRIPYEIGSDYCKVSYHSLR